jgi:LacI family transcriptional regulator, galactose operon repressor
MYTMRDVARMAGVSISSVSAVINGTKKVSTKLEGRVKRAMEALKYQPDHVARSLRTKQTRTVGMVIPEVVSPFFTEMVRGVQEASHRARYSVILCTTNSEPDEEELQLATLYSRRVDGILLASGQQHMAQISRGRCPIVLVDRVPLGFKGSAIVVDNFQAGYEATRHLIELGHRRIGVIAGPMEVSTGLRRTQGFRQAMDEAQLRVPPEYCRLGSFRMQGGYRSGIELLNLPCRPTAILSCNYLMTVGLMRAVQETRIRCPDEISIIGIDDFDTGLDRFSLATLFSPPITALRQPSYEMGKKAFEKLLDKMAHPDGDSPREQITTLKTEMIIRNSTAPPPC